MRTLHLSVPVDGPREHGGEPELRVTSNTRCYDSGQGRKQGPADTHCRERAAARPSMGAGGHTGPGALATVRGDRALRFDYFSASVRLSIRPTFCVEYKLRH